jgi:AGCS family alanine or glycine:cation symporter
VSLGAVIDFSDMMILAMAFPNILGLYLMSGEVSADLKDYMARVKSGAIKKFK